MGLRFNAIVLAVGINLPDKRVDQDCWRMSGFESLRRQLGFKPLSESHQLRTSDLIQMVPTTPFGNFRVPDLTAIGIQLSSILQAELTATY